MHRRVISLIFFLVFAMGCRAPLSSPSAPSSAIEPGRPAFSAEAGLCVEQTNRYRATVGRGPLQRSEVLEEYATAAARTDGLAHVAHQYAHQTNSGNGTSRAENAILWWSLRYYGSVQQVVKLGLADMWEKGEGGSHYRNIVGNYTEAGCGIFVNGDEVTVVQAFR
jgi:uncharacterized protein YkwD